MHESGEERAVVYLKVTFLSYSLLVGLHKLSPPIWITNYFRFPELYGLSYSLFQK